MKLNQYLSEGGPERVNELARVLETTVGHARHVAAGRRPVHPNRCRAVVKWSDEMVSLADLRPDDWHLIWPELASESGAGA